MKKLFTRDKGKAKLAPSDIGSGTPTEHHFNGLHANHRHDRSQSSTPQPDDHWSIVDSDAQSYTVRSVISPVGSSPPLPTSTPQFVSQSNVPPPSAVPPASSSPPPKGAQRERDREREPLLRKRPTNGHSAFAAVGILKALDPHVDQAHPSEPSEDGTMEHSSREEKKERRFWERSKDKDKERGSKQEDAHAELTRMIGYLTATASEDWSLVLEVCERASANESSAKEAAKALRREFKYAEPAAQLSAARLWAIMLRNASELFITQCCSRKFLDTLEDVITSQRTPPVVRERLLDVLAAASYASTQGSKEHAFRHLWKKVKPADKPEEGIPFDTGDAMFYPPILRHSQQSLPPGAEPQPSPLQRPPPIVMSPKPRSSPRQRVIPIEEDIRRLFQECNVGRGNASLLSESLAFAKPEDLKEKDIIREFYARCRASQELISAQIPWAFAGAERSRQASGRRERPVRPSFDSGRTRTDSVVSHPESEAGSGELTQEEQLLAALLAANEELMSALRQYDDLERVGIEREAEERSKKETRMNRSQLRYEDVDHSFLEPGYPNHGAGSSSRSPSPSSPSLSPNPSFVLTPVVPSQAHPLPPIPTHTTANATHPSLPPHHHPLPIVQQISIQSLAPPPHAPLGPRSPGHNPNRSRTPSPDRHEHRDSHHHEHWHHEHRLWPRRSVDSTASIITHDMSRMRVQEHQGGAIGEEEAPEMPVRPSAKALGKRKVVEPVDPDPFDPDDLFYDHTEESIRQNDDGLDSDSDSGHYRGWNQPVQYVYDAAAELMEQRLKEGRLAQAAVTPALVH
ncbi:uncharacterized protein LAESUDRAFT_684169 [Laetiporus sulphureus 93-53]|uniref:VHS domain-containing protein n=1 Tax=Laetiporus sulphureus 93-53 TaxID=1314785 RepID=A0A165CRZ3_9APHY|nr:uncharacterized protein LAESUDRAFT_684169 [Laetiporus sulphureus 93-53]KZT03333.1 hypothetical protein LAESUDRAFT_684169 [Laetiporus sulphureus 93-53]